MPSEVWIAVGVVVVILAVGAWLLPKYAAAGRTAALQSLRQSFRLQREQLEAKFFDLAAASGKPRGLRWVDCDFHNGVVFAKFQAQDELTALVAMEITFEAIEGGLMEDVEAVGDRKFATAVFTTVDKKWRTEGRAIMNLDPDEAVVHFGDQLEPLPEPTA